MKTNTDSAPTTEAKPEPVVQVLPYMGKTAPNRTEYKPPFLTSRGTSRILPLIYREVDDYEL